MLGDLGLDEQRCDAGVEADRQPIDGHRPHIVLELRGVLVSRRECVPIGDEEVALVLVLQFDPILERAMVVAEMQQSAGAHAGEDSSILDGTAHADEPSSAAMTRPIIRYAGSNSQSSHRITAKPSAKNNPTGSIFSKRLPQRCGSNPANTLPASSGGTGSKLKRARITLPQMPAWAIRAIQFI